MISEYSAVIRCQLTTGLGGDPVNGVVGFTHSSHLTAKSDSGTTVLQGNSGLGVDIGDLDLDRGVILGGDQPVCRHKCVSCRPRNAVPGPGLLVAEHFRGT